MRSLNFHHEPDYNYLRRLFLAKLEAISDETGFQPDWIKSSSSRAVQKSLIHKKPPNKNNFEEDRGREAEEVIAEESHANEVRIKRMESNINCFKRKPSCVGQLGEGEVFELPDSGSTDGNKCMADKRLAGIF